MPPHPSTDEIDLATLRAKNIFAEWRQEFDFHPFDMTCFVEFVEKKRQCKIHLIPWTLPPGMSGVWISAGHCEFVFFENEAHILHQLHFQVHELCHILCGHETWVLNVNSGTTKDELLQEIQLALIQIKADVECHLDRARLRFPSLSAVEKEVETLSELIMTTATSNRANCALPIMTNADIAILHQEMGWV